MEQNTRIEFQAFSFTADSADEAITWCMDHASAHIEVCDLHVVDWKGDLHVVDAMGKISYIYVIGITYLVSA